jgi:aminoglycoside phosphotransferase (APT) family kinase protein
MPGIIVAPETRDLDHLARQLGAWLQGRLPEAQGIGVKNLDYPRGAGLSHETILFDAFWSQDGQKRQRGCVLRIRPTGHQVFPDVFFEEQYKLMRALHAHRSVRVAEPYWFEPDPALLGAPFFVMEQKHGRVPVSLPPYAETGWVAEASPAQRRKIWENGVRQLAAVQTMPLADLGFLRGTNPAARDGLAQEWEKYQHFIDWAADEHFAPVFHAASNRLLAAWPKNQPPGLVWGDARLGNMMFDEQFNVVAVMDWEQPSLGGALHDLAWFIVISDGMHGATATRPRLAGMGTREETIALWHEITDISTDDIEWYEDFTRLKLSCCSLTTSKLGRHPPPEPAAMARRLKVALT